MDFNKKYVSIAIEIEKASGLPIVICGETRYEEWEKETRSQIEALKNSDDEKERILGVLIEPELWFISGYYRQSLPDVQTEVQKIAIPDGMSSDDLERYLLSKTFILPLFVSSMLLGVIVLDCLSGRVLDGQLNESKLARHILYTESERLFALPAEARISSLAAITTFAIFAGDMSRKDSGIDPLELWHDFAQYSPWIEQQNTIDAVNMVSLFFQRQDKLRNSGILSDVVFSESLEETLPRARGISHVTYQLAKAGNAPFKEGTWEKAADEQNYFLNCELMVFPGAKTPAGRGRQTCTRLFMMHEGGDGPFAISSAFDQCVYEALCSLYDAGNQFITPAMIIRAMTGKDDSESPSLEMQKKVERCIESFMRKTIQIDAREEAKKRIRNGTKAVLAESAAEDIFGGNFLSAKYRKVTKGKTRYVGYLITEEPWLLRYVKLTKQCANVSIKYLDIKKLDEQGNITSVSVKNTVTSIALRHMLLRRIVAMKSNRNNMQSQRIKLRGENGLYTAAGKADPDKTEAKRIRTEVEHILSFLTASSFIKGYGKYADGRTVAGYEIVL